jgi:hypothetical protein
MMQLRVGRTLITFQCDAPGCTRTISASQGVWDAKNIFIENGWQALQQEDGKFKHYCEDHRRR